MAPRGIGIIASMFLASRMGDAGGSAQDHGGRAVLLGCALYTMSTWTPDVTAGEMMLTMILQGFADGPGVQSDDGDGVHHAAADVARRGDVDAVAVRATSARRSACR